MNSSQASAPIAHDFSSSETLPPKRGRPSVCTPAKMTAICALIRATGISDTAAGEMAGVSRAALSRAKQDEDVETDLGQARAQYLVPRLTAIAETRLKDGRIDWRAQAWLIKFAMAEEYGPPSRRRRLENVELPPEVAERPTAARDAETGSELENVTFRPEIPAASENEAGGSQPPEASSREAAASSPVEAAVLADNAPSKPPESSKGVAIRSEIHGGTPGCIAGQPTGAGLQEGIGNLAKCPETLPSAAPQPVAIPRLSRRARRAEQRQQAREAWRASRQQRAA